MTERLECECVRLQRLNEELAERLAAASAVLSRLAEKDGRVEEIMRLRLVLERIADGDTTAAPQAKEALGW